MSFKRDLEDGKKNEHLVVEMLQSLFPETEWAINNDRLGVDILSTNGLSVECKFDRMAEETGNIFIEVECNGKQSGIYKYDNVNMLTYSYGYTTLMINIGRLKQFIKENEGRLRKIKGGDGWRSVGYLIRIDDIRSITSKIITYDNKN